MHSNDLIRLILFASMVAAIAMWYGCADDRCGCPENMAPIPTIQNIWPNCDGTFWTYRVTVNMWGYTWCDTLYESKDDVPPIPSMEEIEDLLIRHDIGDSVETVTAIYEQVFDGDTTSQSGVTGQNLMEILYRPEGPGLHAQARARTDPFMLRLYMARPDLRGTLKAYLGASPERLFGRLGPDGRSAAPGCLGLECPVLIHGYVWEKTDEWIGTYGDVDTLLAWKFLEADLSAGHEFTHQLVPSLADDVFLHCRVLGRTAVATEVQTFENALECLYVIDYGIFQEMGPGGQPQGYCRFFDYGKVFYVPDVGPVYSYERLAATPHATELEGIGERFLNLSSTGMRSR